ncbi:GIY-YIG nuclease family protein [Patescibacteria group bacterium]|nr:GIY-YIG nuclease family protein [Patescibacteria group bacterium]
MYYVYVLLSKKDKNWFYIGSSSNLKQRFYQHNAGIVESTKLKRPFILVYYEAYLNKKDMLIREKHLKTHQQRDFLKERIKYSLIQLRNMAR